jgi:hypothetical protein
MTPNTPAASTSSSTPVAAVRMVKSDVKYRFSIDMASLK